MPLEREIKLRFESPDAARAAVRHLGASPLRPRRLQRDALLDTADDALKAARSALRLRDEDGATILTFKGPPLPGALKVREEHETRVGDGAALLAILTSLGFRVWFRYEKYREEFSGSDVVIAIDETPMGTFVEIEGTESAIHDAARALGRTPADYLTQSYRALFLEHRGGADGAITFADADRR